MTVISGDTYAERAIAGTLSGRVVASPTTPLTAEHDTQAEADLATHAALSTAAHGGISSNAHHARHQPGGADAIDFTTVHLIGLLAARPSAASSTGLTYFATDDYGGTLYESNGTTWLVVSRRAVELDYAEITASQSISSATYADVTGLVINPVIGTRPVEIEVFGTAQITTSGGILDVNVRDVTGAVDLGQTVHYLGSVANAQFPLMWRRRLTPAAGARQYKVQIASFTAVNVTFAASNGTTGAFPPAFIRCREL